MARAIDIIRGEHRALAAVLNALRVVVDEVAAGRLEPDFQLLSAIMIYIADVPEVVHHPKEDEVLFVRMKLRSPDAAALIDKLEKEHVEGYALSKEVEHALIRYQAMGAAGFAQFRDCVTRYLDFNWRHLNCEEDELLPIARRDFSREDWADVDAAFAANFDPWAGPNREFAALFDRIVDLAPSTIGHGGAAHAKA